MYTGAVERIREPTGEAVEAGLGGAVDVVRPPDTSAGHGTEDDDVPVSLSAKQVGQRCQNADLCDVIGVHDLDCVPRILFGSRLITENTEGENGDPNGPVHVGYPGQQPSVLVCFVGFEVDAIHV